MRTSYPSLMSRTRTSLRLTGKDLTEAERQKLVSSAQGVVLKGEGPGTLLKELESHVLRGTAVKTALEEQNAR